MAFPASTAYLTLALILPAAASQASAERVEIDGFSIDRMEVSIADFTAFADRTRLKTAAEREGGGHEWRSGWERRPGWTFRRPFGQMPASASEPAIHVSWHEARDYCASVGGRLPTREEWSLAAYREHGSGTSSGFMTGRTYLYPTGDTSEGANTAGVDRWPRHAPAGTTRTGVNGLYDMGGNVWEWLADREGDDALTAGGSWWYGAEKMRNDAMQWKPADFYVAYIGFRCAYELRPRA